MAQVFGALAAAPEFGTTDLGPLLLHDWAASFQSPDPGQLQLGRLLLAVGYPDGPGSNSDLEDTPPAELNLTALQMQLLLRRLAVELVTDVSAPPSGQPRMRPARAPTGSPCSMGGDLPEPVNKAEKLQRKLFDLVVKTVADKAIPRSKAASLVTDVANHLLLLAAIHAEVTLDNAPLVRTHDRNPRETRRLDVRVFIDLGAGSMANCWLLALTSVGIGGLKPPESGPGKHLKVFFAGREGTRDQDKDPLIYLAAQVQRITDETGKTSIDLQGRPQRETISKDAPPVDKTAHVDVLVYPVEVSFLKDLMSVAKAAKGGPAKALLETLRRVNPVTFARDIPVHDWQAGRRFTFKGTHTWTRQGPLDLSNPIDSDGTVTFQGELGCLPPDKDANPKVWICSGNATANGHGAAYRSGKTYTDIDHDDCIEAWTSVNKAFEFNAYSTGEQLDEVAFTVDPKYQRERNCDFTTGAVFPLDQGFAESAIPLPDPRTALQYSFTGLDVERGAEGIHNGEVTVTITAEK